MHNVKGINEKMNNMIITYSDLDGLKSPRREFIILYLKMCGSGKYNKLYTLLTNPVLK
jgi:hypothetical protein